MHRSKTFVQHNNAKAVLYGALAKMDCETVDVSRKPECSKSNITFYLFVHKDSPLKLPKEKTLKVTMRSDKRIGDSKNVFVEIKHLREGNRLSDGWLVTCEADYILYIDEAHRMAYILDWPKMKQDIDDCYIGTIKDIVNREDGCVTTVSLVTLDEAENDGILVDCFQIPA